MLFNPTIRWRFAARAPSETYAVTRWPTGEAYVGPVDSDQPVSVGTLLYVGDRASAMRIGLELKVEELP